MIITQCYCPTCVSLRAQEQKRNEDLNMYIHDIQVRLSEQRRLKEQQRAKERKREWAQINERLRQQDQRHKQLAEYEKTRKLLELMKDRKEGTI